MNPVAQRYLDNCYVMKLRLIWSRKLLEQPNSLIDLEIIVLLLRKVVEGIALCCLIAAEIRLGQVPRQIRNNWNAEDIFQFLDHRSLLQIPDCARLTLHDEDKRSDSSNTWRLEIHGAKEEEVRRLISIYGQCHKFLHEFNPYAGMPLRDKKFEQQIGIDFGNIQFGLSIRCFLLTSKVTIQVWRLERFGVITFCPRKILSFRRYRGGMSSLNNDVIVYAGAIDSLQKH